MGGRKWERRRERKSKDAPGSLLVANTLPLCRRRMCKGRVRKRRRRKEK